MNILNTCCSLSSANEFDHVGVFTFSKEEGTPAYSLPEQLPQDVMDVRRDALMESAAANFL